MVAGDFQVAGNGGTTSAGQASTTSQTCDHKCAVITLSILIPLLAAGILVSAFLRGRREKRCGKSKDIEREIAMRKLGPESEASSVTEGFGDLRAVTNLEEEGAEVVRGANGSSNTWMPGKGGSKTPGWWRI